MGAPKWPNTDERLESETMKWLVRLEGRLKTASTVKDTALERKVVRNSMANVNAYIRDCRHFLGKKDYVNAFEAIIYAWGIYETLERMGLVEKRPVIGV